MKYFIYCLFASTLLANSGCRKQTDSDSGSPVSRKVHFELYSTKDFSGDRENVSFKLFVERADHELLWDSMIGPMQLNQIPDSFHKLVVEKAVTVNSQLTLKAGFLYTIEGVGNSWYIDTLNPGTTLKIIQFNFQ